ncbi:MAG TPA: lamin tail domain-containing protein, partial [Verrucomicrobiae bacterium]|nr:lamin tail domain-containing protein [Verrucomicrobiae bacterium]
MRRLILSLFLGLAGFGFAPPGMAATPSPKGAVVINEIMYHPRTAGNEYIELYNNSVNSAFDLGGFRLDGIGFVFAPGTAIPPRGYLVLANNRSAFATAYGAAIPVAGEFGGTLDPGGGTLRLVQPGVPPATDEVICEVTYGSSPPWPADANGGGASLQLIDPAQDTRRVANWGVSTNNAPATPKWQFVALTGIATKSILLIGMTDAGSVYLDDIKLVKGSVPESGVNCLTNGDFESVLAGPWTVSDNMTGSAISTAFSHSGKASLHVVASSGGPTIAQAIWQNTTTLETNATYTLSYWYLPSMDGTSTLIRLSGSSPNSGHVYCLQNFQPPAVTTSLITPGAENSVHATLATIPTVWLNEIVPNNTNGARD